MKKFKTLQRSKMFMLGILALCTMSLVAVMTEPAQAATFCGAPGENQVKTAIDLGCRSQGNPIMDMLFAFIRLLSAGVGIVIIGSIIVAGMQYTMSRGDPSTTAKAIGRIRTSLGALLIYIFAYAILNYVIPGQFFQ